MKKLIEHTYGNHIYMKLELDGKIYEVDWYCESDNTGNTWDYFKTTADGTPDREKVIEAFNELY